MSELKLLSDFFNASRRDPRISISHIGFYSALLKYWAVNRYVNPVMVLKQQIMEIAKISSKATYHKLLGGLSEYGYIRYEPSRKNWMDSKIYMLTSQEMMTTQNDQPALKQKLFRDQLVTVEDLENFKTEIITEIRKVRVEKGGIEKKWLKSTEVQRLIPISRSKLLALRANGSLAFIKLGGNVYYDENDIRELFSLHKIGTK